MKKKEWGGKINPSSTYFYPRVEKINGEGKLIPPLFIFIQEFLILGLK
jgi:hypothetical protein